MTASFLGKGFNNRLQPLLSMYRHTCSGRSPATLRLPCCEEAQGTPLEGYLWKGESQPSQQGDRYTSEKLSIILASAGKQEPLEPWKIIKRCYFEPLSFKVVNYPALDNQNREMFDSSLSE